MSEQAILLSILLTYVGLITAFSVWLARRIRSANEFLLGSRSIGTFALAGSTLATIIGTGATIGATGYAYKHGFAGCLYGLGQAAGIIVDLPTKKDAEKRADEADDVAAAIAEAAK